MSESEKKSEKPGVLASIGKGADKVAGDIVLGGIGQGAFYLHQIPGVKQATRYIGENVRDGWNAADARHQKGIALRLIQDLVSRKETPTADEIHEACVKAGVSEANLAEVKKAAHIAVAGKAAAMTAVKGSKAKETTPTAPSVPLPEITGTLAPGVA